MISDQQIDWPRALTGKLSTGIIRTSNEDFRVDEIPRVDPSGEGEHLWLLIRKRNQNTQFVARLLATLTGVSISAIGFAGIKDRHAVTTQWFSVWMPGQNFIFEDNQLHRDVEIIEQRRHNKKLKRGVLRGNRFALIVRAVRGDKNELHQRLLKVKQQGVPNYFGKQRFGKQGSNLRTVERVLKGTEILRGRQQKSLIYSAMRSWLFNQIVAYRIMNNCWLQPLAGDVFMLDGSHSVFADDGSLTEISDRLKHHDIHMTAPLYGLGEILTKSDAAMLELTVLQNSPEVLSFLEKRHLQMARRAIRLIPGSLEHQWLGEDVLQLEFSLPAGGYATSVLQELFDFEEFDFKNQG